MSKHTKKLAEKIKRRILAGKEQEKNIKKYKEKMTKEIEEENELNDKQKELEGMNKLLGYGD